MSIDQKTGNEILFISSYPPRECGIATYTQDLMKAIKEKFGASFSLKICALENIPGEFIYPEEVSWKVNALDVSELLEIAKKINQSKKIRLIFLQHEFGLFGGECGEDILSFLKAIKKPIITTFHTVLPQPSSKQKSIIQSIITLSTSLVVMTETSGKILREKYSCPPEKLTVIHHGIHLIGNLEKEIMKAKYSFEDRLVLSTFGFLGPGKSIETALNALPTIIKKFPNVLYLIIGKTHPEITKNEGEIYRESLETHIQTLGIGNNVQFINRYVSLEELLEYLQLTDVYLFTSKDPNQAVSGTFAYAMGCYCPVISTPTPHAKEMLSENAGLLFDFLDSKQLAKKTIELLSNPETRSDMSMNALRKIRPTSWQNSAIAHGELFKKTLSAKKALHYNTPPISLDHLKKMTTEFGMIQFATGCNPDIHSGYTLDDNARALIALLQHYRIHKDPENLREIEKYLNFILYSQQAEGNFLNYIDENREFHDQNDSVNLEDSMGRGLWALGEVFANKNILPKHLSSQAEKAILKSIPIIERFESPRAIAFTIKGLSHLHRTKNNPTIQALIIKLGDQFISHYRGVSDDQWKWFESSLTYANAVLPEALLSAYLATGNEIFKNVAKTSFDFLLSLIFTDQKIKVISNNGWHNKGKVPEHFGEQPIEIAYTILALDIFYEVFKDPEYREKIDIAFSWFHGNNHLHQIIYDPSTGGCQDGLEEYNVNLNQGAESTVCYLSARMVMEKYS